MSTEIGDDSTGGSTEANPPWSSLQGVDLNSSVKLTSTLLNGLNYQQWALAISIALEGRGMFEFITGEYAKPDQITRPTEYKQWRRLDCQVLTLLQNSIEPKIGEIFFNHKTSKELWDAITKHYGKRRNHSHIYHLRQKIQNISQNQRTILEYSTDLKRGWEELKIYQLPTSDPNMIKEREDAQVYQFLGGLDDSYDAIRAQILLAAELPHLDDVMATIEGEETRRLLMTGTSAVQEKAEAHAMAARNSNPRSGKGAIWCDNCKQEGHSRDKCWFLHPHLRPKWWKERVDGKASVGEKTGRAAENPKGERKKGFGVSLRRGDEGAIKPVRIGSGSDTAPKCSGSKPDSVSTREEMMGSLLAQLTDLLKPKNNTGLDYLIRPDYKGSCVDEPNQNKTRNNIELNHNQRKLLPAINIKRNQTIRGERASLSPLLK